MCKYVFSIFSNWPDAKDRPCYILAFYTNDKIPLKSRDSKATLEKLHYCTGYIAKKIHRGILVTIQENTSNTTILQCGRGFFKRYSSWRSENLEIFKKEPFHKYCCCIHLKLVSIKIRLLLLYKKRDAHHFAMK